MPILDNKNKITFIITTVLVFVVVFFIYFQFDFLPTSTDSIRIMIGAEEIKEAIVSAVYAFSSEEPQVDDLTIVVVKRDVINR